MTSREVELTGGAPWGFRMHGGADQNQPLRISRRYSDSVERVLDVNPGRKASLSGIREGDIITSINGRSTKGISNAEAHCLLRSAGPVLQLGLNQDREMSPRRRSVGKGSELKRPSQLITEMNTGRATPQAPVYATIRPSHSPQHKPLASSMRTSLNSLPSALNSTPLVKSITTAEDAIRIHPTNPFYTTLPSNNYSSPSKLPILNGRSTYTSLDRNKSMNNTRYPSDLQSEIEGLKSPSFFIKGYDCGPSSLPDASYYSKPEVHANGYASENLSYTENATRSDPFSYDSIYNQSISNGLPNVKSNQGNIKDPFDTSKLNSDGFEKYFYHDIKTKTEYDRKPITNSQSDGNFHTKEEIIKHSTITEQKISEIEEVKTIKKIIFNGVGDTKSLDKIEEFRFEPSINKHNTIHKNQDICAEENKKYDYSPPQTDMKSEHKFSTTQEERQSSFYPPTNGRNEERNLSSSSYYSMRDDHDTLSPTGKFCLKLTVLVVEVVVVVFTQL